MKKVNFRFLFTSLLVAVSFSSYVFLQTVEVIEIEQQTTEIYEEDHSEAVFPDVELVKKVIEVGKMIIPAIPNE